MITDVGTLSTLDTSSSQEPTNNTPENQRGLSAKSHRKSIVHPEGSLREESEMAMSAWDGPVAVRRKMSDDEVVQHYDVPPKEERDTLPGPKKFSQPPASQSTAARSPPDIGDRIMQEEIPLDNRDENQINAPLNVHFLDIFAEPEPTLHSIDCLWTNSYRVFEVTRLWAYRIISLILGLPVAFCCGLSFACVSFNYIWCFHPARRIVLIEYHMIKQIVYGAAGLFCRPVALAFGNFFANIRIHRSQGERVPEEQLLIV